MGNVVGIRGALRVGNVRPTDPPSPHFYRQMPGPIFLAPPAPVWTVHGQPPPAPQQGGEGAYDAAVSRSEGLPHTGSFHPWARRDWGPVAEKILCRRRATPLLVQPPPTPPLLDLLLRWLNPPQGQWLLLRGVTPAPEPKTHTAATFGR